MAAISAALALVAGAAACSTSTSPGSGSTATPSSGATGGTAALTAQGRHFTYIGGQTGDPNYQAVACGAQVEAERLGASFDYQTATAFAPADQIPVLNAAATRNPSGILISPTDPNALYAPLKVINAKIPVETAVNSLAATDSISGQILVNNYGGGQAAADYLAKLANGHTEQVGVFTFQAGGSKAADDEWHGFAAEVKKYPNLQYIGPTFEGPNAQIQTAAADMNAILAAHPHIFGMFASYGFAGEGLLASRGQRHAGFAIVSAYSATTPELVAALKSGTLAAIVDYPFRQAGAAAVDQLAAKLAGKPVTKTVNFPATVYTQASFNNPAQAKNLGPATC